MKNYLHIRHSPSWSEMTEESFLKQSFPHNQQWWDNLLNKMMPQIKWWNCYCQVSYFEYRQKIKDISMSNYSNLHAKIINEEQELPENFVLLCADDDDWYHHETLDVIRDEIHPDSDLVAWDNLYVDANGNTSRRPARKIVSNNYAFTHKGHQKLKEMKFEQPNERGATKATSVFHPCYWIKDRVDAGDLKVRYVSKCLSATNKTLASATVLMLYPKKSEFIKKMSSLSKHQIREPAWASNEIAAMNELNRQTTLFKMML